MGRRIVALVILLCIPSVLHAQSVSGDPRVVSAVKLVEAWLDAQVAYNRIPGMSVAIVHDQSLLWSHGFGYADLEKKIPASPTTIYSICSISKLFTSVAVMQLRDEGRLSLDDPVKKHLAWFSIKETFPGSGPPTIRGLLTHSSGLPRESDFPYWTGPDYPFPTHEQIVDRISKQEMLYPADTYFQYSNLGLTLAGEIVAAASGQTYADYVRKNILMPLGLKDTSPEIPAAQRGARLAAGYSQPLRDGTRKRMPAFDVRGVAPAAGYASTVEDLGRFASWQFRLLGKGGKEVLAANTLKEMQRVQFVDTDFQTMRGLGFSITRPGNKAIVGHGGSCPGYKSDLSMYIKDKLAAIVMTNANEVSPAEYTRYILEIMAPAVGKALESPGKAAQPDPALAKFVGRYDHPFGGETHILIMDGELVALSVPTANPTRWEKLKRAGENTFKRVREDGELGEAYTFELGPDGKVTRLSHNSNYAIRVNP